jgi:hypothetical protein
MAAPDPPPLRRRFVTRTDVEDAHRSGESVTLGPTDVITHEASQRAADLGVTVVRPPRGTTLTRAATTGPPPTPPARDALREAVRAAVVAELGSEPPGLDAAIQTVLARRGG